MGVEETGGEVGFEVGEGGCVLIGVDCGGEDCWGGGRFWVGTKFVGKGDGCCEGEEEEEGEKGGGFHCEELVD